jgi:hypothetical protein
VLVDGGSLDHTELAGGADLWKICPVFRSRAPETTCSV